MDTFKIIFQMGTGFVNLPTVTSMMASTLMVTRQAMGCSYARSRDGSMRVSGSWAA